MNAKIRDAVLLALGSIMLLWMLVTGQVNGWLVTAALACLGVPTGLQAQALSRRSGGGRSSSSAPRSSSPSLSSTSQTEVTDETAA